MVHVKHIPLINYLYLLFHNESHDADDIKYVIETLALIAALIFTVLAAIPMSISMDELVQLNNYRGPVRPGITEDELNAIVQHAIDKPGSVEIGRAACVSMGGYLREPITTKMVIYYSLSVNLCALDVLMCLILLLSVSKLKCSGAESVEQNVMQKWWQWSKATSFFIFISLLLSIFFGAAALHELLKMKLPDYLSEKKCIDAGWVFSRKDEETGGNLYVNGTFVPSPSDDERLTNMHLDPTGLNKVFVVYLLAPALVIAFITAGYATLFAINERRDIHMDNVDVEDEKGNGNRMSNESVIDVATGPTSI